MVVHIYLVICGLENSWSLAQILGIVEMDGFDSIGKVHRTPTWEGAEIDVSTSAMHTDRSVGNKQCWRAFDAFWRPEDLLGGLRRHRRQKKEVLRQDRSDKCFWGKQGRILDWWFVFGLLVDVTSERIPGFFMMKTSAELMGVTHVSMLLASPNPPQGLIHLENDGRVDRASSLCEAVV